MFRFASPDFLWLLLFVPILIGLWYYSYSQNQKKWTRLGEKEVLKTLTPEYSVRRKNIKIFIQILAIVCCVLMIARPQFGTKVDTVKRQGVEVLIAVDVSNSMLASDIAPSRLQKAKQIVSQLISKMENDKVGLIVFAGRAYTQIPITSDYVSAKMFIDNVNPDLVPSQGTAIGDAIELAMNSFGGDENNQSKAKVGRAIIVITDGENFEDDAEKAAQVAAGKGVLVHVIGVGTPEGAPIPVNGNVMSFKKDKNGEPVITKLNEEMCSAIAKAGNGIYVRADNTNNAERVIGKTVDAMAKSDVVSKVYSEYDEQFQWLALITLLLLIGEFFVSERKNEWLKNIKIFG